MLVDNLRQGHRVRSAEGQLMRITKAQMHEGPHQVVTLQQDDIYLKMTATHRVVIQIGPNFEPAAAKNLRAGEDVVCQHGSNKQLVHLRSKPATTKEDINAYELTFLPNLPIQTYAGLPNKSWLTMGSRPSKRQNRASTTLTRRHNPKNPDKHRQEEESGNQHDSGDERCTIQFLNSCDPCKEQCEEDQQDAPPIHLNPKNLRPGDPNYFEELLATLQQPHQHDLDQITTAYQWRTWPEGTAPACHDATTTREQLISLVSAALINYHKNPPTAATHMTAAQQLHRYNQVFYEPPTILNHRQLWPGQLGYIEQLSSALQDLHYHTEDDVAAAFHWYSRGFSYPTFHQLTSPPHAPPPLAGGSAASSSDIVNQSGSADVPANIDQQHQQQETQSQDDAQQDNFNPQGLWPGDRGYLEELAAVMYQYEADITTAFHWELEARPHGLPTPEQIIHHENSATMQQEGNYASSSITVATLQQENSYDHPIRVTAPNIILQEFTTALNELHTSHNAAQDNHHSSQQQQQAHITPDQYTMAHAADAASRRCTAEAVRKHAAAVIQVCDRIARVQRSSRTSQAEGKQDQRTDGQTRRSGTNCRTQVKFTISQGDSSERPTYPIPYRVQVVEASGFAKVTFTVPKGSTEILTRATIIAHGVRYQLHPDPTTTTQQEYISTVFICSQPDTIAKTISQRISDLLKPPSRYHDEHHRHHDGRNEPDDDQRRGRHLQEQGNHARHDNQQQTSETTANQGTTSSHDNGESSTTHTRHEAAALTTGDDDDTSTPPIPHNEEEDGERTIITNLLESRGIIIDISKVPKKFLAKAPLILQHADHMAKHNQDPEGARNHVINAFNKLTQLNDTRQTAQTVSSGPDDGNQNDPSRLQLRRDAAASEVRGIYSPETRRSGRSSTTQDYTTTPTFPIPYRIQMMEGTGFAKVIFTIPEGATAILTRTTIMAHGAYYQLYADSTTTTQQEYVSEYISTVFSHNPPDRIAKTISQGISELLEPPSRYHDDHHRHLGDRDNPDDDQRREPHPHEQGNHARVDPHQQTSGITASQGTTPAQNKGGTSTTHTRHEAEAPTASDDHDTGITSPSNGEEENIERTRIKGLLDLRGIILDVNKIPKKLLANTPLILQHADYMAKINQDVDGARTYVINAFNQQYTTTPQLELQKSYITTINVAKLPEHDQPPIPAIMAVREHQPRECLIHGDQGSHQPQLPYKEDHDDAHGADINPRGLWPDDPKCLEELLAALQKTQDQTVDEITEAFHWSYRPFGMALTTSDYPDRTEIIGSIMATLEIANPDGTYGPDHLSFTPALTLPSEHGQGKTPTAAATTLCNPTRPTKLQNQKMMMSVATTAGESALPERKSQPLIRPAGIRGNAYPFDKPRYITSTPDAPQKDRRPTELATVATKGPRPTGTVGKAYLYPTASTHPQVTNQNEYHKALVLMEPEATPLHHNQHRRQHEEQEVQPTGLPVKDMVQAIEVNTNDVRIAQAWARLAQPLLDKILITNHSTSDKKGTTGDSIVNDHYSKSAMPKPKPSITAPNITAGNRAGHWIGSRGRRVTAEETARIHGYPNQNKGETSDDEAPPIMVHSSDSEPEQTQPKNPQTHHSASSSDESGEDLIKWLKTKPRRGKTIDYLPRRTATSSTNDESGTTLRPTGIDGDTTEQMSSTHQATRNPDRNDTDGERRSDSRLLFVAQTDRNDTNWIWKCTICETPHHTDYRTICRNAQCREPRFYNEDTNYLSNPTTTGNTPSTAVDSIETPRTIDASTTPPQLIHQASNLQQHSTTDHHQLRPVSEPPRFSQQINDYSGTQHHGRSHQSRSQSSVRERGQVGRHQERIEGPQGQDAASESSPQARPHTAAEQPSIDGPPGSIACFPGPSGHWSRPMLGRATYVDTQGPSSACTKQKQPGHADRTGSQSKRGTMPQGTPTPQPAETSQCDASATTIMPGTATATPGRSSATTNQPNPSIFASTSHLSIFATTNQPDQPSAQEATGRNQVDNNAASIHRGPNAALDSVGSQGTTEQQNKKSPHPAAVRSGTTSRAWSAPTVMTWSAETVRGSCEIRRSRSPMRGYAKRSVTAIPQPKHAPSVPEVPIANTPAGIDTIQPGAPTISTGSESATTTILGVPVATRPPWRKPIPHPLAATIGGSASATLPGAHFMISAGQGHAQPLQDQREAQQYPPGTRQP